MEEEATEEEVVGEGTTGDGGPNTEEQEQLPIIRQGSWMKCKVKDKDLLALEKEGMVATKGGSQRWNDNPQVHGITVAQFDKYLSVEPTRS
jgi:hypothetical protein